MTFRCARSSSTQRRKLLWDVGAPFPLLIGAYVRGALTARIVRAIIGTLGLVSVLKQFGVDTAGVIASLGIAGLTLGFAARDTLSNVISGLFILWDRPFVLGDLIEVDGYYGEVTQITLRTTRLVTVDGKMLAIPNGKIANSTVTSYTNAPNLRLDVRVTVAVTEDLGRARRILLGCGSEQVVVPAAGRGLLARSTPSGGGVLRPGEIGVVERVLDTRPRTRPHPAP